MLVQEDVISEHIEKAESLNLNYEPEIPIYEPSIEQADITESFKQEKQAMKQREEEHPSK